MIFSHIREMSIGKKLSFFITLCSLTTFLIMCLLFFSIGKQYANVAIDDKGHSLIVEGQSIAENACSYLRGVAEYYCSDPKIQHLVQSSPFSSQAPANSALYKLFQNPAYLLNVVLYNAQGEPVQYVSIDGSEYPINQQDRPIFQELKAGRTYYWEYIDAGENRLFLRDNSPKICLWRAVKGSNNSATIGAIAITMDVRWLLRYNMPYNSSHYKSYILIDAHSQTVVTNYTDLPMEEDTIQWLASQKGQENLQLQISGSEYSIFSRQILDTPLWVFSFVSKDFSTILEKGLRLTMVVAIVAYLISFALMLTYVYRRLTKPLGMLTNCMNCFAAGNFDTKISFRTDDDIGRLGKAFNQMVEDNRNLIEKTYVAQLKAKEAEFQLMQTQINPHFIYNLINSLQWTALRHGEKEIADTANSMGQMLRICLNRGNAIITIAEECELIRHYLKLQKNRYRERLEYKISLDDASEKALIPKLIIQPLVENSVVHGLESVTGTTHITVNVTTADQRVHISVCDDGAGIDPQVLRQLPRNYQPSDPQKSGYALRNIYERLSLLYGENFSFTIQSEPMKGTQIDLELPLSYQKPNHEKEERFCLG